MSKYLFKNKISKIPFFISDDDRQKYISDIEALFERDEWDKDIPHYQTYTHLFERKEPHWTKLKQRIFFLLTFLNPNLKSFCCWAYVSFVGKKGSTGNGWHTHSEFNNRISGIIYLQTKFESSGTMFDVGDTIIIPKIDINSILVYDSRLSHSPQYWNYENATQNRIVLAFDGW